MLFLYFHFEPNWLKITWIPVSIALVLVQLWVNLRDRMRWLRAPDADADKGAAKATDLTTLIFLGPSLALNLRYAFW
jgi:hypothetical protein